MNLYAKLSERAAQGKPLRVGLIGAGKFGAMYLAQVPKTPGVHLVGIADLSPANAQGEPRARRLEGASAVRRGLARRGAKGGRTHVGEDWQALVAHPGDRHHRRGDRQSGRGGRARARRVPARQARGDGHGRGRRVLRSAARAARRPRRAWCTAWPTATSRRSSATSSTGRAPPASTSSPPGAATSGCRTSRSPRRRRCGATTASRPSRRRVGGLNPKMFNSFLDGSKPAIESTRGVQRHRPDAGALGARRFRRRAWTTSRS